MSDDGLADADSPFARMENAVYEYEDDYKTAFEAAGTESELAVLRKMQFVGTEIAACLATLRPSREVEAAIRSLFEEWPSIQPPSPSDIAPFVRTLSVMPIVRQATLIALAHRACDLASNSHQRSIMLAELIASRRLSERAAWYLDRATQAFLWGLDAECVMLSRSVLEAALADVLSDRLRPDEKEPDLYGLVELAGKAGVLDGYGRSAGTGRWFARPKSNLWFANEIRKNGNRMVHDFPDAAANGQQAGAYESLKHLAAVLTVLFPAPAGE